MRKTALAASGQYGFDIALPVLLLLTCFSSQEYCHELAKLPAAEAPCCTTCLEFLLSCNGLVAAPSCGQHSELENVTG